ncbi:ABC transporter substrate-binding protein [Dactylosporangium darangshiense]|uniref:ABC transporter substrate-binding protein n=1 Tax=Dactylosporangium darangshiense TaxID=579108 RepID=UPI00362D49B2
MPVTQRRFRRKVSSRSISRPGPRAERRLGSSGARFGPIRGEGGFRGTQVIDDRCAHRGGGRRRRVRDDAELRFAAVRAGRRAALRVRREHDELAQGQARRRTRPAVRHDRHRAAAAAAGVLQGAAARRRSHAGRLRLRRRGLRRRPHRRPGRRVGAHDRAGDGSEVHGRRHELRHPLRQRGRLPGAGRGGQGLRVPRGVDAPQRPHRRRRTLLGLLRHAALRPHEHHQRQPDRVRRRRRRVARLDEPGAPVSADAGLVAQEAAGAQGRRADAAHGAAGVSQRPRFAGARLAVQDLNAAGGVLDQPVEWVDGDDGTDATVAAATVDRFVGLGVQVIIGASSSSVTKAVIPKIAAAGRILVSPSSTSDELTTVADNGLFFRTAPPDTLQARALADVIMRGGSRRVTIMAREDAYGLGLQKNVKADLLAAGMTDATVDLISYPTNTEDFGGVAARVRDNAPEGVLILGYDETALIVKALAARGVVVS